MHALVTGAGGFLGQYIVEQLVRRGARVRAMARRANPALRELGIECVQADVRDARDVLAACEGVDTVVHAAAVAGIWGTWEHFHGTNTLGTRNVLDACRVAGVRRLIYTSSPSVTFRGADQTGTDESDPYPTKWLCHYSHTKALAEQEVLRANARDGLLTCALRPHLIWGPRDRHLIPRLVERARAGQLRRVGRGRNLIDMIYVENAAEAHLLAADALRPDSPVGGRAYYLSQGEPVNCWHWISEILAVAGAPPVKRSVSYSAAWLIGAVLETVYSTLRLSGEPRMTRFLAAQLAKSHFFDIRRAERDFGYRASVSTDQGMERLANWLVHRRP